MRLSSQLCVSFGELFLFTFSATEDVMIVSLNKPVLLALQFLFLFFDLSCYCCSCSLSLSLVLHKQVDQHVLAFPTPADVLPTNRSGSHEMVCKKTTVVFETFPPYMKSGHVHIHINKKLFLVFNLFRPYEYLKVTTGRSGKTKMWLMTDFYSWLSNKCGQGEICLY